MKIKNKLADTRPYFRNPDFVSMKIMTEAVVELPRSQPKVVKSEAHGTSNSSVSADPFMQHLLLLAFTPWRKSIIPTQLTCLFNQGWAETTFSGTNPFYQELVALRNTSQELCAWFILSYVLLYTEMKMSSFWWNFHHRLHWKLSKWQLPVQPVMKIFFKSLFALEVVKMTTFSAASDDNFDNMTFLFQCG